MKDNWQKEFADRFARHEDELKWLYYELYHCDAQAYDYFTDMLYRCWNERAESLRMMDRAREAFPDWYKGHDLTGMLMYVNAFAGTLQGVRKKLDYIADCGVNYLHLMPLLESPKDRSDGGYAVSDFRKVQPELGTMEDLRELAEDCHARGIAVCLDFVMNHTARTTSGPGGRKPGRRITRPGTSSTTAGRFRTPTSRRFRRYSRPPRRATSPGARRRGKWS